MHSNKYLSSLAACLALAMASSAHAADPIPLQKTSFKDLQQQFKLALPGVKLPAGVVNTLHYIQEHTDQNKIAHIRMQQEYLGYAVYGGYAIMHSKSGTKGLIAGANDPKMTGLVYSGLQNELGQPSADFVKKGAEALDQLKAQFRGKDLSEETVSPVVYIDSSNKASWAYRVSVLVSHDDKIPERATAIVDAETFKPFIQWNDIKTVHKELVKGRGFGGNTKAGQVVYGRDLPLLEMTRNNRLALCYMETKDVKVVDMNHRRSSANRAMSFDCEDDVDNPGVFFTGYESDGYDRINGAFSPSNDALYAGYVIKHMYHDWYGVEVLKNRQGNPMQLVLRVHYDRGYENAYWDGRQMTFGDGAEMMYPLVSMGVGAHEISHGFTEQHSNLEYYGQSGGMNESFSDMAAQAAEFYSTGMNTWMIGSEIMKEDSGYDALRYMDVPSMDGDSIDRADEYYPGLDVHYSSGVYNRLFYLMSTREGWDTRKAFDVMVKANMDYWTPLASYTDAACGLISAAEDLGFSVADIKESLDEVAINHKLCDVVILE